LSLNKTGSGATSIVLYVSFLIKLFKIGLS
jgi:hypothetical protein